VKLKIVSNGYPKIFNLCNLSRNLSINSEIYLIKEDEEILLGFINHHTLVYFCVEFADYSLQNYTKVKIPKAEKCISLVRKWIKDPTSVSKEDLEAAYHAAYNTFAYASAGAANSAIEPDYAYYAFSVAVNTAVDAADYAGKKKEEEYIRQGEFILDYLKSGLYLFHLEK
jgi:hypothetical protein